MFFKFKNGLANCNEWYVREETIYNDNIPTDEKYDCLYLHYPSDKIRSFDLKLGSKEKIFECYNQNYVDLSDCEI